MGLTTDQPVSPSRSSSVRESCHVVTRQVSGKHVSGDRRVTLFNHCPELFWLREKINKNNGAMLFTFKGPATFGNVINSDK